MSKQKVILIGLDGATFDLLEPWMQKGELPTFKKIKDKGIAFPMLTTAPPISASAWASLYTGKNPGKHGIVDFFYLKENSYDVIPINSRDIKAETLFSMLSRANKKVVLVNLPIAYPPEEVNGILISGLHTPSEEVNFTFPEELKKKLNKICNGYKINAGAIVSKGNIKKYLEILYEVTNKQLKAVKYLLKEEDWDFFMYVIQGTDQIQHALWHLMDENHPLHISNSKYKGAILDFYKKIDNFLDELLREAPEHSNLIIVSDHGAGPLYKLINLNNWLIERKFLMLKKDIITRFKKFLYKVNFTPLTIFNILLKLQLGWLKKGMTRGRGHGKLKKIFLSFDNVDWEKTKAYSLGNVGQIYINLYGREHQGQVQASDYNIIRQDIKESLLGMRDEKDNVKVIDKVFFKEEIYKGDYLDKMPDIIFLPKSLVYNSFGHYEFASNKLFEIALSPTCTHRMNGIFMAYGDNIISSSQLEYVHITDIAPTILNLMGIEILDEFDGRVLSEIFKNGRKDSEVIKLLPKVEEKEKFIYKEEEIEKVRRNLQDLGYIG